MTKPYFLLLCLATACGSREPPSSKADVPPPPGDATTTNDDESTTPDPDPAQCGTLKWIRTVEAASFETPFKPRFLGATAVAGATPDKTNLALGHGTNEGCGRDMMKPTSLDIYDDNGALLETRQLSSERCSLGLGHDGTRFLTLSRASSTGGLEIVSLDDDSRVVDLGAATAQALAIRDGRAWLRNWDGYVSFAFPAGGDRSLIPHVRVGSRASGPTIGLASGDFGLWGAREAFEGGMTNFLFVLRPPSTECAFPVEKFPGMQGTKIWGMAARGNQVFVLAGNSLVVFEHDG